MRHLHLGNKGYGSDDQGLGGEGLWSPVSHINTPPSLLEALTLAWIATIVTTYFLRQYSRSDTAPAHTSWESSPKRGSHFFSLKVLL